MCLPQEDALAETSYLADVAGLRSHVNPSGDRFEVKVDGFNEKVPLLAQRVFASLTALPEALAADRDRFGRVREAFEKRFRNALIKPLKHATYLRLVALRERVWTNAPLLEAVKGATEEAVVAHLKDILSASHVEARHRLRHPPVRVADGTPASRMRGASARAPAADTTQVLAMGNMTADEAAALAATVAGYATPPAGLPAAAWPTERIVRLPPGGADSRHCLCRLPSVRRQSRDCNASCERQPPAALPHCTSACQVASRTPIAGAESRQLLLFRLSLAQPWLCLSSARTLRRRTASLKTTTRREMAKAEPRLTQQRHLLGLSMRQMFFLDCRAVCSCAGGHVRGLHGGGEGVRGPVGPDLL